MKKYLMIILVIFSLAACATVPVPPSIELNPQPSLQARPIGQGKTVVVQVIDARAPHFGSAVISSHQNVSQIFAHQLGSALTAYGFTQASALPNPSSPQLIFRIMNIDYSVAKGYFGSNTETTVSAQVEVKSAQGSYMQTYRASAYSDNYLKNSPNSPSQQVNTAINQLLTSLFNDQTLWQFLAK